MTNSELMLAAITNGDESDTATAAALDALREEGQWTLLGAILEIARVYKGTADARDMKEAMALLNTKSAIQNDLTQSVLSECPDIPPAAPALILVVDGDRWPTASKRAALNPNDGRDSFIVSVGARWVKREASRLIQERERAAARPRRRRSR